MIVLFRTHSIRLTTDVCPLAHRNPAGHKTFIVFISGPVDVVTINKVQHCTH